MTGIIILAAGKSERLGQPKQLLELGDNSLLNHTIDVATKAAYRRTILVLGAYSEQIIVHMAVTSAVIVKNPNWQEGIASSIRIGLQAMLDIYPETDSVICMVCDQPYISTLLLNQLILKARSSVKGIVASEYKDIYGTPVLFKNKYFNDLMELCGDEGAKKLILKYAVDVDSVPFPLGHIDIDTSEDAEKIKDSYKTNRPDTA